MKKKFTRIDLGVLIYCLIVILFLSLASCVSDYRACAPYYGHNSNGYSISHSRHSTF